MRTEAALHLSALSPSAKVMNMTAYEEYKQEHPEELIGINRLMAYAKRFEKVKEEHKKIRIAKIEMCRRLLYGEHSK